MAARAFHFPGHRPWARQGAGRGHTRLHLDSSKCGGEGWAGGGSTKRKV